jgi:hypothetical protein
VLVQLCPPTSKTKGTNLGTQENFLDALLDTVLENNRMMNKSQTLIPLGMAGAGKTRSCLVMLRRLLRKCGYDEQTDMVKQVEAAGDVIRPLVTACVSGSKMSSRMVRFGREYFNILIINYFRQFLLSAR